MRVQQPEQWSPLPARTGRQEGDWCSRGPCPRTPRRRARHWWKPTLRRSPPHGGAQIRSRLRAAVSPRTCSVPRGRGASPIAAAAATAVGMGSLPGEEGRRRQGPRDVAWPSRLSKPRRPPPWILTAGAADLGRRRRHPRTSRRGGEGRNRRRRTGRGGGRRHPTEDRGRRRPAGARGSAGRVAAGRPPSRLQGDARVTAFPANRKR